MSATSTLISLVIPIYNEQDVIELTLNRIINVLELSDYPYEIVLVNDGSSDKTERIVCEIAKSLFSEKSITLVNFRRNYGHMMAIQAGYEHATGDLIFTIDADLQDPPELILQMLKIYEDTGADVVQAVRTDRKSDSLFKRWTAKKYYATMKSVTGLNVIPQAADFRMCTRAVVDEILTLRESHKIMRLLIPELGFRVEIVGFERQERGAGQTKYTFTKMLNLGIDSILAFSNVPLRILTKTSFLISIAGLGAAICAIALHFLFNTIPGWTSLIFLILSMNSILLCGTALVGEYIGNIYRETLNRPNYTVRDIQRFQ